MLHICALCSLYVAHASQFVNSLETGYLYILYGSLTLTAPSMELSTRQVIIKQSVIHAEVQIGLLEASVPGDRSPMPQLPGRTCYSSGCQLLWTEPKGKAPPGHGSTPLPSARSQGLGGNILTFLGVGLRLYELHKLLPSHLSTHSFIYWASPMKPARCCRATGCGQFSPLWGGKYVQLDRNPGL